MNKKISIQPELCHESDFSEKIKLLTIFLFGFSSGIPFLLLLSTLSVWLTEAGVSKTQIGIFAWITISYSIKFVIAPIIDNIKIPFLCKYLGHRRSWLLSAQLCLIVFLIALANTDPSNDLLFMACYAFIIGFCSAIQDIITETYRIEILDKSKVGIGTSISVLGYRVGMLCSGAGAIYIAAYFQSWAVSYSIMAFLMFIGVFTTLLCVEPTNSHIVEKFNDFNYKNLFHKIVLEPIKSFVVNNDWKVIIIFILCYKFADTVLNVMSMPFLIEMGFTKVEIAYVAKTFGIITMLFGGVFGGIYLSYKSLWKLLILSSFLQFAAACLFILQSQVGHNVPLLFFSMGIENFTCGLAQVALLSYISSLCINNYTAVHYAILTSFASFIRVWFSALAGFLADNLLWQDFYSLVCISCVLSIFVLGYFGKHFSMFKGRVYNRGYRSILSVN